MLETLSAQAPESVRSRLYVASRIASGMMGGYAFTWGFIALGIGLLFAAGLDFQDAETLGYVLGFLVFLVAFLLAFAARSLTRVWIVLADGGAS